MPWLFDWHDFDDSATEKAFDVALHLGTLVAVVAYFRKDLAVYIREGVAGRRPPRATGVDRGQVAWLLLLATIPAALVGAVFEDQIDEHLGTPGIIAVSLILVRPAAVRAPTRRSGTARSTGTSARDAVVDRRRPGARPQPRHVASGITITAGRFLRFDRDAAARISFLMMIPVTAGAVVFKMAGLRQGRHPRGPAGADGRRDRHVRHHRLDRGVGHAEVRAHAQLPAVRRSTGCVLGIVVLVIVAGRLALTAVSRAAAAG